VPLNAKVAITKNIQNIIKGHDQSTGAVYITGDAKTENTSISKR
jgi:hypothetical protein